MSLSLRARLCSAIVVLAAMLWSAQAMAREHTVRQGQTLAQIARRYRVSVSDLQAANRLRSSNLQLGQVLQIPSEGEIYVRRGESLSHVARRVNVSQDDLRRANRLRRGRPLRIGQRLILPGYSPAERIDRDFGTPSAPGTATIVRRGEAVEIELLDDERRVIRESLDALGHQMRRGDDDESAPPNPRLALLLATLSDHFGGRPIIIVSGYRAVGGYTRETSRHTRGRATDIRIQGVPERTLWEVCRRIDHAGCGFYPRSTFVHVDARLHRTQWVDWSRPGQASRYGTLRGPARSRQRRAMSRPRVVSDLPLTLMILEPNGSVSTFEDSASPDELEDEEDVDELIGEDDATRPRPLTRIF